LYCVRYRSLDGPVQSPKRSRQKKRKEYAYISVADDFYFSWKQFLFVSHRGESPFLSGVNNNRIARIALIDYLIIIGAQVQIRGPSNLRNYSDNSGVTQ